jgi:hypothetical protein
MFKFKNMALLGLAVLLCVLSGCVPAGLSYRTNPRFSEQASLIRTVAVLPSEVKVFQIDVGNVREEIAEWSAQARTNVLAALENELRTKLKAAVRFLDEESLTEEKDRLEETRALYSAVSAMILIHTYPNPNFPSYLFEDKQKNFDYSLGREVDSLAPGADALLLLDAEDHIWTAGRQALQALGVILGIGAAVGTGVVAIPQLGGGTSITATLVDNDTGDILWINTVGAGAGKDLRDPASASEMVSQLFKDFPMSHDRQPKEEESR